MPTTCSPATAGPRSATCAITPTIRLDELADAARQGADRRPRWRSMATGHGPRPCSAPRSTGAIGYAVPTGCARDYGTPLRDDAAMLTLGLETAIDGVSFDGLVRQVNAERQRPELHLHAGGRLVAARRPRAAQPQPAAADGRRQRTSTGLMPPPSTRSRWPPASTSPTAVRRRCRRRVTLRGVPEVTPRRAVDGYAISRSYYTLDGDAADPSKIGQGDRLVAVLEMTPIDTGPARLMINDPLPAGFEIDNPAILKRRRRRRARLAGTHRRCGAYRVPRRPVPCGASTRATAIRRRAASPISCGRFRPARSTIRPPSSRTCTTRPGAGAPTRLGRGDRAAEVKPARRRACARRARFILTTDLPNHEVAGAGRKGHGLNRVPAGPGRC